MKFLATLFLIQCVFFFVPQQGQAEQSEDPESEYIEDEDTEITEYVTVATRKPEDPNLCARTLSILSEKELKEQSPNSIPEALFDSPGIFVQKTNHGGGSPIIRGMIGPQNLIVVDGVRFNNSVYRTGPTQYLNLIDPHSISRIEILRGPGSVLYGSDAMGGVIELFPLSPKFALDYSGKLVMKYDTSDFGGVGHIDFNKTSDQFGLLGGVTYKTLGDLIGGGDVGTQKYSGYDNISATAKAVYKFPEGMLSGWKFSISYLMTKIWDAGRTDKLVDKHSLQIYNNNDDLLWARLSMRFDPIDTKGKLTFSYQHFFERKDTRKVENDLSTEISSTRDEVTANTFGVDLTLKTDLIKRLILKYGGMFYKDWVDADRMTRTVSESWNPSKIKSYTDGSSYSNYGLFIFLEGKALESETHNIRLSAGYRLHGMKGLSPSEETDTDTEFTHVGHIVSGSIFYSFKEFFFSALSFSQGFRAPNLSESAMLGDTGKYYHIPNYDLKPESSNTLELLGRINFKGIRIRCTGYVSWLDNLIRREGATWEGLSEIQGKTVAWNVNAKEGILFGAEGEIVLDLPYDFTISTSLSYTFGEEKIEDETDIPLTRIPPLFGQTNIRWDKEFGGWSGFISTGLRYSGKQDRLSDEDKSDVRIPEGGTPGWWIWNAQIGVISPQGLFISLKAENLLDEKYKYHASGLYSAGRHIVLNITIPL